MSDGPHDLDLVWSDAIAELDSELSAQQRGFLKLTRPVGLLGTTALLAAPNAYTQKLIESKLRPKLTETLSRALGRDVQVAVTVEDGESLGSDTAPSPNSDVGAAAADRAERFDTHTTSSAQIPAPSNHLRSAHLEHVAEPIPMSSAPSFMKTVIGSGRLNPRYTFENFVRGPSNRLAYAAANAVAEAPAKAYNPLFIYGGSGLGKTHLLHAIGNYAHQIFPGINVLYVSSEEFTNDFINTIANPGRGGGDQREKFRKRYREVDILMIDDIQFLERAEQTQEEFFHTFNTLHNADKQIVITSDRTPKELTTLEDRLRSRFAGGLTPDIHAPDLETRLAILQRKASQEGLSIKPEVLELIATKIQTNIRELEGALIRVAAYANLTGQGVDLNLAQEVIKDLVPDAQDTMITAQMIMNVVANYFDVSIDDLCGRNRSKVLVMPRQIAMYLCRELTDLSLPRIGQHFGGKDHTTVMHAVRKVTNELTEKRHIYNHVASLTSAIRSEGRR